MGGFDPQASGGGRMNTRTPANLMRKAYAYLSPRPVILLHKPTKRCDCLCSFCDAWKDQPEVEDTAPTEKILDLQARARRAGMTDYTVWGGEPLMATELPLFLKNAQRLGFETTVCSSGQLLEERAADVAPGRLRLFPNSNRAGSRLS